VRGRGWRRGTFCSLLAITGLLSGLVCDAGTVGGGIMCEWRRDAVVDAGCDGRGESGSEVMSGAISRVNRFRRIDC
jgi:hypothetical protein